MQTFKLDHGWEIAVPDGWVMDNQESGSYIFYPPDPEDTTTLYASVIHSEHQQMIVPEYMMRDTFERSIPANAQGVSIITSVHCRAFTLLNADGTYRIGAGYFFGRRTAFAECLRSLRGKGASGRFGLWTSKVDAWVRKCCLNRLFG